MKYYIIIGILFVGEPLIQANPLINELREFCLNNNHKYITFLDDDYLGVNFLKSFFKSGLNVKSKAKHAANDSDMLIIFPRNTLSEIKEVFELIHLRKIKNTILVVDEEVLKLVTGFIKKFKKNASFYLLIKTKTHLEWNEVLTMNNMNEFIISKLIFDSHGKINEQIDLKGK